MTCCYWIFDLDGTLTVPAHDFEGIRKALGFPSGKPILEEIAKLPKRQASWTLSRLEQIELEVAQKAVPQEGAAEVVHTLRKRGGCVGIFTRNSERNVWETLRQCGLEDLFCKGDIMARDSCNPKPHPEGIHVLLSRWKGSTDGAVMVGDYLYDMIAGRKAGVVTVGFHGDGHFPWKEHADYCVTKLPDILKLPIAPNQQSV